MYEYGRKRDYDEYGNKTSRYYSQPIRNNPTTYGNNIYGSYGRKQPYAQNYYRPPYQGYRGQGYGNFLDKRIIALVVGTLLVMACIGIIVYIALPKDDGEDLLIQTEIRFNGTYDPNMSIPGSDEYNELRDAVCPDLTTIPKAIRCELIDVREGSFLAKFIIFYLRTIGATEAADSLEDYINGRAMIGGLMRLNTVVATEVSASSASLGCNTADSTGLQWPCHFGSVCTTGEFVSHRCQCEAVHAAGDDCDVCAEGYYRNTAVTPHVCAACPENTYKPGTGNGTISSCLACTGGTTTNGGTGKKLSSDCQSAAVDPSESQGGVDPTSTGGDSGMTNTVDAGGASSTGGDNGDATNTADAGDPTTTGGNNGGATNTAGGGDGSSTGGEDGGTNTADAGDPTTTDVDSGMTSTEGAGGASNTGVDDSNTASIDPTATTDGIENTESASEQNSATTAIDGSSDSVQESESSPDPSETLGATESMSESNSADDTASDSQGDSVSESEGDSSSMEDSTAEVDTSSVSSDDGDVSSTVM